METVNELDRYLERNDNQNYWSNEGMFYAGNLLEKLNEAEWDSLKKIWMVRSVSWQVKLADTLYRSDQPKAVALLLDLLRSSEIRVAAAAAANLEAKDYMWKPDESLRSVLEELLAHVGVGERTVVQRLIARISE